MKRRTRLFVFGAAGILVVGLGTGLVASYAGLGLQNFAIIGSNGPDELAYVPSNIQWVAFANVREVMDSQLRQKIREYHPEATNGPEHFRDETGIDIEHDIDHVVVAGRADAQIEHSQPLVLARGRFDQTRIEGLVREHGGQATEYKGKRFVADADSHFTVAFLEPDLVAVGTTDAVRGAIDTKQSGGNVTTNTEIMRLVHDIDDGNAWAVARFDALTTNPRVPPEVASRLPAITWFSASGHVNGGLRGSLRAIARDEMSAQDLREVIRGFMALARLQVGQRTEFADLLDSIQLSGQGTSVAIDFSIPSQLIDTLGALHAQRPNLPAAPGFRRPNAAPQQQQPRTPSL